MSYGEDYNRNEALNNHTEQRQMEMQEALGYIGECLNGAGIMGANDSELLDLKRIETNLITGVISPQAARKAAYAVVQSKNPYH